VATGRTPNTGTLGLDRAGVTLGSDGFVVVDAELRTSRPHIWAAGDVIGRQHRSQMATPVGARQGRIVAENAFADAGRPFDGTVIPRTIFTDPPIAVVGETEAQVLARHYPAVAKTTPLAYVPRAGAVHKTTGFVKFIASSIDERVLGVWRWSIASDPDGALGDRMGHLLGAMPHSSYGGAAPLPLTLSVMPHRIPVPTMSIGWRRAQVPGRGLPAPESPQRRLAIRLLAIVALTASVAYLGWRVTSTIALDVWWVSIPLVVLEIHATMGLALFAFSLWDVDVRPDVKPVLRPKGRVSVLIPTYNEGIEVLMPTVAAALAMRLPHETWVLDDGNRPEVERLAKDLGARYLTRPDHHHAKAGNLNHALGLIDADFIAVLDADHVAAPDFLVHTLGYFDDPRVAIVQTPQDFYNQESFEHDANGAGDGRYHEQVLFYRVLQPGKNRWGAAFWCGTGAVVRTVALREVGGVATDTITEDIHTTIRLHRRGWKTVYHNEVLARGLAAGDADTYQLQRHRWGTGAMQVLKVENPFVIGGLTVTQRLAYAATLLGWFDAWRSLGYLIIPMVVLATGAVPITADPVTFSLAFGATFILQQIALRVLSRGCHRPILTLVFELVRMTPNLLATLTLLSHRRARFQVTPKGRMGDGRRPTKAPVLLRAVSLASVVAAAWFTLSVLGLTPVHYGVPWAAYASFGWLVVNLSLVVLAIRRVRSMRFAPERRSSVRFETSRPGSLGGAPVEVLDLSLTGARVELVTSTPGTPKDELRLDLPGLNVALDVVVRSRLPAPDGRAVLGLEFLDGQHSARAALALGLFQTHVPPQVLVEFARAA
jgi:cellulose synthase (UDP-forming)